MAINLRASADLPQRPQHLQRPIDRLAAKINRLAANCTKRQTEMRASQLGLCMSIQNIPTSAGSSFLKALPPQFQLPTTSVYDINGCRLLLAIVAECQLILKCVGVPQPSSQEHAVLSHVNGLGINL